MSSDMFRQLVFAIVTVVSIIITSYVVPFINAKIGESNLNTLNSYIAIFVKCAEQIFTSEQWKEKKAYVMSKTKTIITEKLNVCIAEDELSDIIEGAVYQLKNGNK